MERLTAHARRLLETEDAIVLGGDYNVCPSDDDLYDPEGWADDALCRAETRQRYRELVFLGLTDALRVFNPQSHLYTFWDYQGGAWQKDNGLRIDHLLLSPQAADRLSASGVDRGPRNKEKPSDHTPVWCELEDGG
jgi:exodeoxyribonuclease-3